MKTATFLLALAAASVVANAQAPRQISLFFDLNSVGAEQLTAARDNAIRFVEQQAAPMDSIAVMTYTSQLNVLQDFTADRNSVVAALRGIAPAPAAGVADAAARLKDLQAAIGALAPIPDKKMLVYFSSPGPRGADSPDLRDTVNAAIRGNIAIYSVNAGEPIGILPPPR